MIYVLIMPSTGRLPGACLVWDWMSKASHRKGSRCGTWEYFPLLENAIEFQVSQCTGKYVRLEILTNGRAEFNYESHPVTPEIAKPTAAASR